MVRAAAPEPTPAEPRPADALPPAAAPLTGPILLTGGTGFVGSAIRRALGHYPLRLLVRDRASAELVGNHVEVVEGDVTDPASLRGICDGCSAVIHLVAIIEERGGSSFDRVIRGGTVNVVAEAKRADVGRFLHMSAMGVRNDPRFGYFEAKWQAEQAVRESGLPWTIFRPSVIFGPGDGFINVLASLVRSAPVIPVVGSGASKFQPVAVDEVATAFATALTDPAAIGQTYELGGGRTYSYEQMLDLIAARLGVKKQIIHVPVGLMMPIVRLSTPLPKALRPPVTLEQLKMLAIDNCSNQSATASLIGRPPRKLEDGLDYIVNHGRSR